MVDRQRTLSRRNFLAMGSAAAAAGTLGPVFEPLVALGATAWPKGYEPAGMFAPAAPPLVDASYAALRRARAAPAGVLKPLNPRASGDPNDPAWPGEGQYLFAAGGIPTSNYITGPTYLLNWGISTADKIDHRRVRAEAIAFTEMILRLARTPRGQLIKYTV